MWNRSISMATYYTILNKAKNIICVCQVSLPYQGFCPDPKHFIVNYEQNIVNMLENELKCCKNALSI